MMRPLACAAAAAVLLSATAALGGDGDLGTQSSASAAMALEIPRSVKLSGVDPIVFSVTSAGVNENINVSDPICVYSNTGKFQITATGDGPGFAFKNGEESLDYLVFFNVPAAGAGNPFQFEQLQSGTLSTTSFRGDSTSIDCSGATGNSTYYEVAIRKEKLQAASAGDYTGSLTLTVVPANP